MQSASPCVHSVGCWNTTLVNGLASEPLKILHLRGFWWLLDCTGAFGYLLLFSLTFSSVSSYLTGPLELFVSFSCYPPDSFPVFLVFFLLFSGVFLLPPWYFPSVFLLFSWNLLVSGWHFPDIFLGTFMAFSCHFPVVFC